MKKVIGIFFVLLITVVVFTSPVFAAGIIEITDTSAILHQSLDMDFREVGAGDELVQVVEFVNSTNNVHAVYLISVEVLEYSLLLDALTFDFVGNNGIQLTLTKDDFSTVVRPEIFLIAQNTSDSFTIKVTVGNITNEYQELSCKIRYTFEIANLEYSVKSDSPGTGDKFNAVVPAVLAVCSFVAIVSVLCFKYKSKKEARR